MPVETTVYCAKHPNVETALTCASCGTPICVKCMVVTPVGMKCPDCGSGKTVLSQISPKQLMFAVITSLAAGMGAAIVGALGFFVIFISIPYGYFAGKIIMKAAGMKRGRKLELIAGTGIVIGAIVFKLLPAMLLAGPSFRSGYFAISFGAGSVMNIFFLAAVIITTFCAVSKIRYI